MRLAWSSASRTGSGPIGAIAARRNACPSGRALRRVSSHAARRTGSGQWAQAAVIAASSSTAKRSNAAQAGTGPGARARAASTRARTSAGSSLSAMTRDSASASCEVDNGPLRAARYAATAAARRPQRWCCSATSMASRSSRGAQLPRSAGPAALGRSGWGLRLHTTGPSTATARVCSPGGTHTSTARGTAPVEASGIAGRGAPSRATARS
ncbi:MAG: hypothetical protein H6739_12915 [Alphaproteobacteria bacterium]|nr:hypothetical protein [Alphaproteobacteria bacterium]